MADKLRFNEELLRSIVSQLASVAGQLDAIKGKIDGLSLEEEAGALHRIGVDSHRLIFGRDFGGYDTVEDHLGSLSQAVLGESLAAGKISSNLSQVIDQILACENSLEKVIGDEVHPMTEEQRIAESIERAQIEAILNILRNARNPDDLLSVMKRDNFNLLQQLATGLWAGLSGNWHDIGEQQKIRYLFKEALSWINNSNIQLVDPSGDARDMLDRANDVIGDFMTIIKGGADAASGYNPKDIAKMVDIVNKCKPDKIDLEHLDTDGVKKLLEKIQANPELSKQYSDLMNNSSLKDTKLSELGASVDFASKMDKIGKALDAVDMGKRVIESGIEIGNQLSIIEALDKDQIISNARVYIESGDPDMQRVGRTLEKLANAGFEERVAMIATGELADAGFDLAYDKAYDAAVNAAKGNPIVITAQITAASMDLAFSVNDIPGLQNDLGFSTTAARSTYEVLQNDLRAYEANPTNENLQNCISSYNQYQQQVATAEEAAAALFKNMDDSFLGTLNSEQRAQMEQCVRSAESARNAVNTMNTLNHNRGVAATARAGEGNFDGLII